MDKRLAVIVPVLDEAAGIDDALRALAPLRERGAAVIVVDGGSRDGTAALAAPLADAVVTAPRGRALQMNAGARHARDAGVLLFLHADTRLPPDADRLVVQALARSGRCWGRFDVRIAGRSRWLAVIAALMNLRSRASGICTGDQAIFVRRDAFDAVGGFPEQPLMEDIEISRRLRRRAPPLALAARVVTSGRRWERDGVWRTVLLMSSLRLLYFLGMPAERLAAWYR